MESGTSLPFPPQSAGKAIRYPQLRRPAGSGSWYAGAGREVVGRKAGEARSATAQARVFATSLDWWLVCRDAPLLGYPGGSLLLRKHLLITHSLRRRGAGGSTQERRGFLSPGPQRPQDVSTGRPLAGLFPWLKGSGKRTRPVPAPFHQLLTYAPFERRKRASDWGSELEHRSQ